EHCRNGKISVSDGVGQLKELIAAVDCGEYGIARNFLNDPDAILMYRKNAPRLSAVTPNLPSKTGHPSGKLRGNAAPKE
ncbi:hypothetical protein, partial [Buttiauxella gaviniae]|uniref:hypothetical protein n=1 Tax=Buttiauxella gaviniae TaxID=82990 RepID=UPI000B254F9F